MSGFHSGSDYARGALIMLLINICIHVVAFGSPFWTTRSREEQWEVDSDGNPQEILILHSGGHAGLWEGCTEGECYERYNLWVPQWLKSVQTFFTLALVCMFFEALLLILYIFHRDFDRDKRLTVIACILAYLSTIFSFLSWAIWAGSSYLSNGEQLNWPFYMAIISSCLNLLIALFIHKEVKTPLLEIHHAKAQPLAESMARFI